MSRKEIKNRVRLIKKTQEMAHELIWSCWDRKRRDIAEVYADICRVNSYTEAKLRDVRSLKVID